jgi:hypothetical protein
LTIRTQKNLKFFNPDVASEVVDKIAKDFQDYYGKKNDINLFIRKEFDLIKYSLDKNGYRNILSIV